MPNEIMAHREGGGAVCCVSYTPKPSQVSKNTHGFVAVTCSIFCRSPHISYKIWVLHTKQNIKLPIIATVHMFCLLTAVWHTVSTKNELHVKADTCEHTSPC